MAKPSEIIDRAQRQRRMKRPVEAVQKAYEAPEIPLARPAPTRHGSYTRLMQSHDRMGTRHLSKSGG